MTRVTLVLNQHGATSETFQRTLARTLAGGGYDVTVHALEGALPSGPPLHPRVASSVGDLARGGAASQLRGAVREAGPLAQVARRARARYGWTSRAAVAAAHAAPILATEPDIIHVGFSGIGVSLADVWPLVGDVPLVVSCRGSAELVQPLLDPARGPALHRLFERTEIIHVVAAAVGDAVVALGADPDRVRIVRPAVDLDRWKVRPPIDSDGPLRLVSVGRLVPAKGLDDLFAAVAVLRDRGVDVTLTVIGDGPHRDPLRLRAARSGLDGVVDLVGSRTPDDVAAALAQAHLLVSPSWSEGINNGVLEAMASGVPVVSTAVGGMGEVITDGEDGWLVGAGRPDQLAEAIERAAGDPDQVAEVVSRARARIEAEFGLARQEAEWLAIYGGLSGGAHEVHEEPEP
ncbi:MAG: glycosyltransferase family 4 protein [Aquihabitans sp.]